MSHINLRESRLINIHKKIQKNRQDQRDIMEEEGLQLNLPSEWDLHYQEAAPRTFSELLQYYKIPQIEIPQFELTPIENAAKDISIKELPVLDESVFARWRILDIPVMLLAGAAGAGLSYLLRGKFDELHESWGKTPAKDGGHAKETIDWVSGKSRPGGFGHRWEHGHDILNPFEVNWSEYYTGSDPRPLPRMAKLIYYWVRHLIQDTFSKEGLPIPGHSLLRDWLKPIGKNREILQILGTIKARDLAGAGLTNTIMAAYLWGTEKSIARVTVKANYRAFSLMAGANLTAILVGLLTPPPATSFNYPCIPPLLYYGGRLIWMSHKIDKALETRQKVIESNHSALLEFDKMITENDENLAENQARMETNRYMLKELESARIDLHKKIYENFDNNKDWSNNFNRWEKINSEEELVETVAQECLSLIKE